MTILLGNLLFCSYVLHPSPAGQVVTLSITSADLPRGEATFMIKAPYRAHLP